MDSLSLRLAAILLAAAAMAPSQDAVPFPREENLFYTINWPSGLSLGEGELHAAFEPGVEGAPGTWKLHMRLEAAVPGFAVSDNVRSISNESLCSLEFERELHHGERTTRERTVFDLETLKAKRQTLDGGGSSELSTAACPQDVLAFLFSVRQQLARGRIPPQQKIYYGAAYEIRLEYVRAEPVRLGSETVRGERLKVTVKGDVSEQVFEIVFERDGARRPLRVQVPLELGSFTMELQP